MATNNFDPTKLGATKFDPTTLGATPLIPKQVPKPQKDALDKATKILTTIFPGEKVGQAIGTLAGFALSKNKESYDLSAPSPLQVAGDVVQGGLSVAGVKGVGTAGKLGARVLKQAALGAGIAGSGSIADKQSIVETIKNTAVGGLVGGALPLAGAGLRAVGRQIENLPSRFVDSALGRTKSQVLKNISNNKTDEFAQWVIKSKPVGSASKLADESVVNVSKLSEQIGEQLKSSSQKIGRDEFLNKLATIPEAEGSLLDAVGLRSIVEKLAPQSKKLLQQDSLTLSEANKLRQLVDKTLGDRAFLGGQLSSEKIILKKFADNLREEVKSLAPSGTREQFKELANEINFRDGLLEKIAKRQGNQVLSFGDFVGGGLGGIFGGGVQGAVLGVGARRVLESVPFKMFGAKATKALTKAGPVINSLSPAQQTVILNLISEILSNDDTSTTQN